VKVAANINYMFLQEIIKKKILGVQGQLPLLSSDGVGLCGDNEEIEEHQEHYCIGYLIIISMSYIYI
jgi:hypothetical protein